MTQPGSFEGPPEGVVTVTSPWSTAETVKRLLELLDSRQVRVFTVVDHSGAAAEAGYPMPDTKLVIFGSPVVGTPLMLSAPSAALDLPLKILIAEGPDGRTRVSYNDPRYLARRHLVAGSAAAPLAAVAQLVEALIQR